MNRYYIIHGAYGKPFENWFLWLEETLTEEGKEVIAPQFPTPKGQNYENWKRILESYEKANLIDEDTIFIAHSMAPIFICKFLIEKKLKIKGIISVAGANGFKTGNKELDTLNESFFMEKQELEQIGEYIQFAYCFYSDNDPYISEDKLEEFSDILGAEKNKIKGAGHFNLKAGYIKFPEILEVIHHSEKEISLFAKEDMPIGVNAIILNEKGEILLSKRKNRFGAGTYSLIGGKLKKGETLEEGIIREVKEEIDIEVKQEDIEVLNIASTIDLRHFIQIGIRIKKYEGTIQNKEPNKCEELKFFPLDNLPELFSGNKANIELYKENKFYDKTKNIKWEEE